MCALWILVFDAVGDANLRRLAPPVLGRGGGFRRSTARRAPRTAAVTLSDALPAPRRASGTERPCPASRRRADCAHTQRADSQWHSSRGVESELGLADWAVLGARPPRRAPPGRAATGYPRRRLANGRAGDHMAELARAPRAARAGIQARRARTGPRTDAGGGPWPAGRTGRRARRRRRRAAPRARATAAAAAAVPLRPLAARARHGASRPRARAPNFGHASKPCDWRAVAGVDENGRVARPASRGGDSALPSAKLLRPAGRERDRAPALESMPLR